MNYPVFAEMVDTKHFRDDRGFFTEVWNQSDPRFPNLVQFNLSKSSKGIVRGMHFNIAVPQAKLLRVPQGSLIDVVVDLRRGSPNFGVVKHFLLDSPQKALYVPEGYAHGFQTLTDNTLLLYGCSQLYCPKWDRGISPRDKGFHFPWLGDNIILSEQDKKWPTFDIQNWRSFEFLDGKYKNSCWVQIPGQRPVEVIREEKIQ